MGLLVLVAFGASNQLRIQLRSVGSGTSAVLFLEKFREPFDSLVLVVELEFPLCLMAAHRVEDVGDIGVLHGGRLDD